MREITTILLMFIALFSFGQNNNNKTVKYSENSPVKVFYSDSLKVLNNKMPALYINGAFVGGSFFEAVNISKIEEMHIEKEYFTKDGIDYYGKIFIKMKPEYNPVLISFSELVKKYLKLDNNPIIFQINEKVISENWRNSLIDEKDILKIIVTKVKTSERNVMVNLIKLITKTPENIEKENEIRIRGIKQKLYQ